MARWTQLGPQTSSVLAHFCAIESTLHCGMDCGQPTRSSSTLPEATDALKAARSATKANAVLITPR